MAAFGNIGAFDSAIESWSQYTERLQQFFAANEIETPDRKRAIFLTVVGPTTYGLLRDLLSPAAPTARTMEQLIETLNNHFDPAPSEIVERYKFNSRIRHAGESVAKYIAELRRMAKFCNYGASLDEMLRDRIVCGIHDEAIQRKLLSETDLTLQRTTEIAVSMEAAARDTVDLRMATASGVHKIQTKKPKGSKQKNAKHETAPSTVKKCYRCGDANHQSGDCKYKNATCHFCHKVGHLAKVCLSKSKVKSTCVNKVQAETTQDAMPKQYILYNIKGIGFAPPPAEVVCSVEGEHISFEVDSGAPFTLMPAVMFDKFKRLFPPLENTNIKLQSYTKHQIDILGVTNVDVTFQARTHNLPLLVVKQGTTNLAGRNWIVPLRLMAVFDLANSPCDLNSLEKGVCQELTLERLLDKFKGVFTPKLGSVKDVKVHLTPCPTATPKFFKARPVPYALRDKVDREIDRLIEEGILEPIKTSVWAAPIVPVLKHDGRIRICGDFKLTINKATELEQYPLPKIEDLFAQLSGGETFSKLDLRDAYCQLELDDQSRNLVVINTQRGLFRYTRLPFGIASAPAIFQREIDKILQGLKGACCYLDDLLITGKDRTEHLQNLCQVLTRLEAAGIKLHSAKCEFLKASVEYLGHRIDKHGLHPIESKVEAIVEAPNPMNVEELRSFIGLVTYYAKFLPNMATVLAPLYELLRSKQTWKWGAEQIEAFSKIKTALQSSSLLVHFDNNKEVILACDASPYGLGAVLSHETPEGDRPIAFASRSLTTAEKNYSHIEKETLALVFGVTKFRNYLLGRKFTLLTDHRPLVNLLSEDKPVPSVAAARIQRWALTLSAYAYQIRYRKGDLHGNADACSRLPLKANSEEIPVFSESVLLIQHFDDTPVTAHMIEMEIEKCSLLKLIRSYIKEGWPKKVTSNLQPFWLVKNELSVEQNIIFRGSRIFLPPKFRDFVVDELHGAHQGISAIKSLARSYVWWPGIDRDLEAKVQNCIICQENASSPPAKQMSWPVPAEPWERIHIDHAGPVEGYTLLVVIDAKTKWLEVLPVPSTSSSATITALRKIFAQFGVPKSLVSDNAAGFCSAEFYSFLGKNGITHIRTAPYHPNSNGLAERSVRTVKAALLKIKEGKFEERLTRFLFYSHVTPLAATGVSPAVNMFGRSLRTRLDLLKESVKAPEGSRSLSHSDGFWPEEPVWVRNFGRGPKWVAGKVLAAVGKMMFRVQTLKGTWTRHMDQIRRREDGMVIPSDSPSSCVQDFSQPSTSGRREDGMVIPSDSPSSCVQDFSQPSTSGTRMDTTPVCDEPPSCCDPDIPTLSPQGGRQESRILQDLSPPLLSPQLDPTPRRFSKRVKRKPQRLGF